MYTETHHPGTSAPLISIRELQAVCTSTPSETELAIVKASQGQCPGWDGEGFAIESPEKTVADAGGMVGSAHKRISKDIVIRLFTRGVLHLQGETVGGERYTALTGFLANNGFTREQLQQRYTPIEQVTLDDANKQALERLKTARWKPVYEGSDYYTLQGEGAALGAAVNRLCAAMEDVGVISAKPSCRITLIGASGEWSLTMTRDMLEHLRIDPERFRPRLDTLATAQRMPAPVGRSWPGRAQIGITQ